MKKLATLSLCAAFALAVGCKKNEDKKKPDTKPVTKTPDAAPAKPPAADNAPITPDKLSWNPLDPSKPDGNKVAVVHGNPQEGPAALFLKVPAKGSPGIHTHTAGYHAVVVSGSPKHWLAGEKEKGVKALAPGSYWYQPGGQAHGDSCGDDAECVVFIIIEGKFDMKPEPDAKPIKDKGKYKLVKPGDAKFAAMAEKGPKVAPLWGDQKAGPFAFMLESAPGTEAGTHKHTSEYHALVLAGTPAHWADGEAAPATGVVPGSYWYQPAGEFHNDKCLGDAACRLFVFMPKGLDMTPKDAAGGDDSGDDDPGDDTGDDSDDE